VEEQLILIDAKQELIGLLIDIRLCFLHFAATRVILGLILRAKTNRVYNCFNGHPWENTEGDGSNY
jgi:hypothetical protein